MLTIARLTALSLGDASMNDSHWNHMKELEAQVARRIQEASAASGRAGIGATAISPTQTGPLNTISEDE